MAEQRDTDAQLLSWALSANLEDMVQFHNYIRSLLREKYHDPTLGSEKHALEKLLDFDRMNLTNTFLAVFAYLEEMLYLLWKVRGRSATRAEQGSALERYSPVLKAIGLDAGRLGCWSVLSGAAKVRHCLLHANGRISMMKHPDDLERLVARSKDELLVERDKLVLQPAFLRSVVTAVTELRDAVLDLKPAP